MAITLNELKAKFAATQASTAPVAPAVEAPKVEVKKTFVTKSVEAIQAGGRAIDGALPVSKKMFAEMATKRLDEHDLEFRLIQHELDLLAHNRGEVRVSREDLIAYDAQLQLEKEQEAQAALAAEQAANPEAEVTESVINQLAAAMAKILSPEPKAEPAPTPVKEEVVEPMADTINEFLGGITDPVLREKLQKNILGDPNAPQVQAEDIVKYEELEQKHLGDIDKGTGIYAEKETVPAEGKKTGRRQLPRNAPLMN